ncbi:short-chain dehydrogenase [Arenicella chitinivorans]|uniref:Short-chain dehydrogenase n=1 Tax=Arenicella chitinivorans TaxID=1329800 RepID=A0A918S0B5_9GAMM|nr:SDR family NAD(P)-dependent oxidoreductase [Arenicella chitinivorans]GHA19225.1 short-chain dehydrogenase [Arenicella chitinivorans]
MNKFQQSVAVVTGAASGIGRELALELARRGARIAISDIDQDGLVETKSIAEQLGAEVLSQTLDVSNREAVFYHADQVEEHFGQVNLVINNAGVALKSGTLQTTSLDEFEWLMGINFFGVLYGTKAFLPILERARWGHIVNLSSLFGLIGVPEQSAYNASKFAVRGMTEALRQELELSNSTVSCTSVHPGGVKTDIARNARVGGEFDSQTDAERESDVKRFDKLARTSAASAANQILDAVLTNKRRLLIGRDAKMMDVIQRVAPNGYHRILHKVMRETN